MTIGRGKIGGGEATGPRGLSAYVALVLALGAGLCFLSAGQSLRADAGTVSPVAFAFWLLLSLAAEICWLPVARGSGMVSMSLATNFAVLFVLPWRLAVPITAASVACSDLLFHKRTALRAAFNASQTAVSLSAAAGAMMLLGGPASPLGSRTFLLHPMATVVLLPVFTMLNTMLVAGAIALEAGQPLWRTWRETYGFGYQFLNSTILFVLGLGIVVAVEAVGYVSGLGSLLLLLALRDAYKIHNRRRALAGSFPPGPPAA